MTRWDTLIQQVNEILQARRLGTLVFARCMWQSDTPPAQLPPKLARWLDVLSQWMQPAPEKIQLTRTTDHRDVTLLVEFRPSATAVISHVESRPLAAATSSVPSATCHHCLGVDLFLLGTQGAIYLDGTQADWPHERLAVPDLPAQHPLRLQVEKVWR
ncbi:hypothetical protein HRbin36_02067 [bacterium HR36]|nr:hypothetical protein HRbin36_02067 [bacterium HR36]